MDCGIEPIIFPAQNDVLEPVKANFESYISGNCSTSFPITLGIFDSDEKIGEIDIFSGNKTLVADLGKPILNPVVKRIDPWVERSYYDFSCVIGFKVNFNIAL